MFASNPFLAVPEQKGGLLDYVRSQPLVYTQKRQLNLEKLVEAIYNNETGASISNPYAYSKPSGSKTVGKDLGKYQVTEGELATYAKRFLGKAVTAAEFLANPELQEKYIRAKVQSLFDRGLTAQEILASHRRGMSDLTREGLDKKLQDSAGYVSNGMKTYLGGLQMGNVQMPEQKNNVTFQHNPFLSDTEQSRALIAKVFPAVGANSLEEYTAQAKARNEQMMSPEGVLSMLPGGEAGGFAGPVRKVALEIYEEAAKAAKVLPISALKVSDEVLTALKDVKKNIKSKSNLPLLVTKNKDGVYEVLDGKHRLAEQFLNGAKQVRVITDEKLYRALAEQEESLLTKVMAHDRVGTEGVKSHVRRIPINTAQIDTPPVAAVPRAVVPPAPPRVPPSKPISSSPIVPDDPVQRLIQALREAKPIRGQQEALYSKARAQKVARVASTQARTSGEAGFYKELGQLKGELPKVNYESIRPQFEQADIDHFFNMVKDSPKLDLFEQITARGALVKMLGGEGGAVPTVGELKLLNQVFPKELVDELLAKRPFAAKLWEGISNALNVPRSIMSSFDLSAPFRQGVFLVGRKEFYPAFAQMFKKFGSEKAFQAANEEIASRPTFKLMKQSKLALTEMDQFLTDREEAFMSNWAEKIPGIGKVVRASGRAYVGFLNKLRADVFDSLVKDAKNLDIDFKENPKALADLAKFINSATGRGDLGSLNKAAPMLNAVFFSPRLMASRLNLLNPVYYVQLDPFVRKQAIKSLLSFATIAGTVMGLAKMGGASVNADPTNADFAKVKVGNTRYDVLGGFQQYIRLASQLIAGKITSSTTGKVLTLGEGYKPMTRLDILERFFQTKENPVASFVTNFLQGQDVLGNKFNLTNEVINRFIPLIAQDTSDALREHGAVKGALMELPAIFGVGTQTYGGPKTLSGPSNPFLK